MNTNLFIIYHYLINFNNAAASICNISGDIQAIRIVLDFTSFTSYEGWGHWLGKAGKGQDEVGGPSVHQVATVVLPIHQQSQVARYAIVGGSYCHVLLNPRPGTCLGVVTVKGHLPNL